MDFIGTANACEQTHLSMMPGDPAYKGQPHSMVRLCNMSIGFVFANGAGSAVSKAA